MFVCTRKNEEGFQISTLDEAGFADVCAEIHPLVQKISAEDIAGSNRFSLMKTMISAGLGGAEQAKSPSTPKFITDIQSVKKNNSIVESQTAEFLETLISLLNNQVHDSSIKTHQPSIAKYNFLNTEKSSVGYVTSTNFCQEYNSTVIRKPPLKFNITTVSAYVDDGKYQTICTLYTDESTDERRAKAEQVFSALRQINSFVAQKLNQEVAQIASPRFPAP